MRALTVPQKNILQTIAKRSALKARCPLEWLDCYDARSWQGLFDRGLLVIKPNCGCTPFCNCPCYVQPTEKGKEYLAAGAKQ